MLPNSCEHIFTSGADFITGGNHSLDLKLASALIRKLKRESLRSIIFAHRLCNNMLCNEPQRSRVLGQLRRIHALQLFFGYKFKLSSCLRKHSQGKNNSRYDSINPHKILEPAVSFCSLADSDHETVSTGSRYRSSCLTFFNSCHDDLAVLDKCCRNRFILNFNGE